MTKKKIKIVQAIIVDIDSLRRETAPTPDSTRLRVRAEVQSY